MDTFDIYLYLSYTLVIIATLAAIILPLINAFGDPKGLLKSLIGVAVLVVLYFISYALASNEVTPVYTRFAVGPELSKIVGGSLILMYILLLIAIVGIVYTEIVKLVK
jgi:hypothetical protein